MMLQVKVGPRRLFAYCKSEWHYILGGALASAVLGLQVRYPLSSNLHTESAQIRCLEQLNSL